MSEKAHTRATEKAHTCGEFLRAKANAPAGPMAGLPGAMLVSESAPVFTADEFPPQVYRCPHGTRFWAYPDAERIAALRALNGVN